MRRIKLVLAALVVMVAALAAFAGPAMAADWGNNNWNHDRDDNSWNGNNYSWNWWDSDGYYNNYSYNPYYYNWWDSDDYYNNYWWGW